MQDRSVSRISMAMTWSKLRRLMDADKASTRHRRDARSG